MEGSHPSFGAGRTELAYKEGINSGSAGAILRDARPKTKLANPLLKKVKQAKVGVKKV